ncbi:autotransporter outer membrane beta-barrel domain-containing protein [Apirhabdus apintestini]|nr:autotransporter outer membrane beta-barrel domain-containing protein [Enterobacteriaceae bacterium CA-0114]
MNWLHNTRSFATKMDGVNVSQDGARNLGEVKVGLEGQITPRFNLWGNVGFELAIADIPIAQPCSAVNLTSKGVSRRAARPA